MIHTSLEIARFFNSGLNTWPAILLSQHFDSQNGRPCFFVKYKENHAISRHVCVDHYTLLLNYLSSNHVHFITRFQTLFKDQLDRSKAVWSFYLDVF